MSLSIILLLCLTSLWTTSDKKQQEGGAYSFSIPKHCQNENDILLPCLQGLILKPVVMLHIPEGELARQREEAGSNVRLVEVQLARMTKTAALQSGDILDQLGWREKTNQKQQAMQEMEASSPIQSQFYPALSTCFQVLYLCSTMD